MSFVASLLPRADPASVVREHGPEVVRRLKRIFGPAADVDDVYQNVFVEVLRSLPSFAGRARLSTWIRRITYNVAYQEMRLHYRDGQKLPIDEAPASALVAPGLERQLESREALRGFHAALAKLDIKQRVVVALHDVEGCTLKEIGETLGRPLPTVASQLAAGRAALAHALAAEPAVAARAREEVGKP